MASSGYLLQSRSAGIELVSAKLGLYLSENIIAYIRLLAESSVQNGMGHYGKWKRVSVRVPRHYYGALCISRLFLMRPARVDVQ